MSNARIDFLRGVAALGVVLFHVRTDLWVGWAAFHTGSGASNGWDACLAWLGVPMSFMGAGVVLFFALSGYCIHWPQAQAAMMGNDKPDWMAFFRRRLARIYPPYLGAVLLSVVVLGLTSGVSGDDWRRSLSSGLMLQNYVPPVGQISSNPSLWSLPVEAELYLAYPLWWWLGQKFGWAWACGLALLTCLAFKLVGTAGMPWAGGCSLSYCGLWCAGAWVADLQARKQLPVWHSAHAGGLAMVVAVAVLVEVLNRHSVWSFWCWSLAAVGAVFWAADVPQTPHPRPGRLMILLAKIGTFSFSLYLIHYPLFKLAGWYWVRHYGDKPSSLLVALLAVAAVVPLAWLYYHWVERPTHRLARFWGARKLSVTASVAETVKA